MKKLFSILICICLLFVLCVPAFASDDYCYHAHNNQQNLFDQYRDGYFSAVRSFSLYFPCCDHFVSDAEKTFFIENGFLDQCPVVLSQDQICPFCGETIGAYVRLIPEDRTHFLYYQLHSSYVVCYDCGASCLYDEFTDLSDLHGGCSESHSYDHGVCTICGHHDSRYVPDPEELPGVALFTEVASSVDYSVVLVEVVGLLSTVISMLVLYFGLRKALHLIEELIKDA